MTNHPNPPEHLPATAPEGFALPEKRSKRAEPNRWAAFTDDELAALWVDTDPSRGPLVQEIQAELERRKQS